VIYKINNIPLEDYNYNDFLELFKGKK